jgi:hypothetical protein
MPDVPAQRRDLGLLLARAERPGAAVDHLRHYLRAVPAAEDAEDVGKVLRRTLGEVARWN